MLGMAEKYVWHDETEFVQWQKKSTRHDETKFVE
jgi:hypothetical protein